MTTIPPNTKLLKTFFARVWINSKIYEIAHTGLVTRETAFVRLLPVPGEYEKLDRTGKAWMQRGKQRDLRAKHAK